MKVLIIGGGPVGIFASWVCGMYSMQSIIVDSLDKLGGQCAELYPEKTIYDIPAISALTGQDLVDRLVEQASIFKKEILLNTKVVSVEKVEERHFKATLMNMVTYEYSEIEVSAVVIVSGRGAFEFKRLELEGASLCENNTLFYAVRNKEMFRNKTVIINGGGDSAGDYTRELAMIAKKVYLIHRREEFRFSGGVYEEIRRLENVKIIVPETIERLNHEDGKIYSVTLSNLREISCDYVLCFFGLQNYNGYMSTWGIEMINGKIAVNHRYSTNILGISAISDCAYREGDIHKKLILHSFGEAYSAIYYLSEYLQLNIRLHFSTSSAIFKKPDNL